MSVGGRPVLCAAEAHFAEDIPPPSPQGQRDFAFVGTASCSAANCHGGDSSRPPRQGTPPPDPLSHEAYSIWIQRDPHAWAYSTLLSPESRRMAERLGYKSSAHQSHECLACHSPLSQATVALPDQFTPHDGVSCEACHGAAEKWLDPHKWDAWRSRKPEEKAAYGFRDTASLVARAKLCAQCHVGSDGRDVNHDLIAAGHPRLSFELSAYHANLPKHWQREDSEPAETIDARLWQIGQVASAEAALGQVARRATSETAPWPEFAEYDCFACHHELRDPSWRQERGFSLAAGSYPWGTWYFSLLREATPEGESAVKTEPVLQQLAAQMGRSYPDRHAVAQAARECQARLDGAADDLANSRVSRPDVLAMLSRLASPHQPAALDSWDAASQRFLAASAVYHSAARLLAAPSEGDAQAEERIAAELESIRERLLFPQDEGESRYLSPRDFDGQSRRKVMDSFAAIREHLESWQASP
jgi:hypothetical protein